MIVYTRCKTCQQMYDRTKYCPRCGEQKHRARSRTYNKKRGPEVRFYNSKPWKAVKAEVINYYHSIDLWILGLTGKLASASRPLVHHIIPYKEDEDLALDFDNLVPVSTDSHNMIHRDYYDSGRRDEAIAILDHGKELFEKLKNGDYDQ